MRHCGQADLDRQGGLAQRCEADKVGAKEGPSVGDNPQPSDLQRHFGLLQATALNVTMIVGAGVFITIPLMLGELPGPWALLGWVAAGLLILVDSLIWSELAATLPGSGGTYLYLLECFGRDRWGRLMAFLFVWQFLISGPLEIASGLIAITLFAGGVSEAFNAFNQRYALPYVLAEWQGKDLLVEISPARVMVVGAGILLLVLLYRRITFLGKLTVTFWVGVLGVIFWILIEGALRFDPAIAFAAPPPDIEPANGYAIGLGAAMILAIYSYLGYYNVCYISDEVRDPGRTIPRSIQVSALLVCVLFIGLHLAMLGTVRWQDVPARDDVNLPAVFMRQIHGPWAATLVSLCLIWSCLGAAFAALLGYSRIPYGAARHGHFFAVFGRVHPTYCIPHLSLLLVGGLTLFWSFFDLANVINALIVTRILEQFIGQIVGVVLLRRTQPERPRPYRILLYPLPCLIAMVGWLYVYGCAGWPFMVLGLVTLLAGTAAFFGWSWWTRQWPFTVPTG
jgi:amino acid transporter